MSNDSFYVRSIAAGMGEAVAQRTILRKQPDGSWETWKQVSERVALGNSLLAPEAERDAEYTTLRNHIAKATVLMSGRHLQHGDAQQPVRPQEVYTNCSTAATAFLSFYLLLNGSGVGRAYDDDMVSLVNWDNSPNVRCVLDTSHPDFDWATHESLRDAEHKYGRGPNVIWHEVADSREGWAKALELWEVLTFEKIHRDKTLVLDFSPVRAKNSPIAGMQNRPASGPVPLMGAFNKAASIKGAGLPPWRQSMYVDHYFAECVLVGGARRAARMATKYWQDPTVLDFVAVKRPIEYLGKSAEEIELQRAESNYSPLGFLWSSNNSVTVDAEFWSLVKDESTGTLANHAKAVFKLVCDSSYADGTGEPGFINVHKLTQNDTGWGDLNRGDYVGSARYQVYDDTQLLLAKLAKKAKRKRYHMITNPCFNAGTLILTDEGPRRIETLVGKTVNVYDGVKWVSVDNFRVTGKNQKILRIDTDIAGSETVTFGHTMILKDGTRIEAQQLRVGDKLKHFMGKEVTVNKVLYIGEAPEVYCCTIPETHSITLASGIVTGQCGEISINILGGFCVIADVVPFHADTIEEAEDAFTTSAKALIRVNLMDSIYSKEVTRTNRIGVGFTGIHEFAWKFFGYGFADLVDEAKSKDFWLTLARFNRAVRAASVSYSKHLGLAVPHTCTTVKPAGTTSKLFGLTEGAHLPSMREFLRYVQFRNDDPLVSQYREMGYPVKELTSYQGTSIVGFPTAPTITTLGMGDKLVTAPEASPEDQFQWLKLLEKYWIHGTDEKGNTVVEEYGNQVSYCLAAGKNNLVNTDKGLIYIEDFVSGVTLPDRNGISQNTIDIVDNGVKNTLSMRLENGAEIIGTAEHKILTLSKVDNSFEWKTLSSICVGDMVVRRLGSNSLNDYFSLAKPPTLRSDGRRGNLKAVNTPDFANEDFGLFLGMLMSDGHVIENGFGLTNEDDLALAKFTELCQKLFGLTPKSKTDIRAGGKLVVLEVNSRLLSRWLVQEIGLPRSHDDNHIPNCILRSPHSVQKMFLRGYTLDGYAVKKDCIAAICSTVSKTMACGLQTLLFSLGYDAVVNYKAGRPFYFSDTNKGMGKDQWAVVLGQEDSKRFVADIQFLEPRKNKTISDYVSKTKKYPHRKNSVWAEPIRTSISKSGEAWRGVMKAKSPRMSVDTIRKYLSEDEQQRFSNLLDPNLRFTIVSSIGEGPVIETYDITVAESHEYVSNGIVVHNTLKYLPKVTNRARFTEMMLEHMFEVRCVSVMPQTDATSFEYQPETPLSKGEYEHIVRGIKDLGSVEEDIGREHIDCASGACPITFVDKHAIQPAQEAA